MTPQGLKPRLYFSPQSARLKPCSDTNPILCHPEVASAAEGSMHCHREPPRERARSKPCSGFRPRVNLLASPTRHSRAGLSKCRPYGAPAEPIRRPRVRLQLKDRFAQSGTTEALCCRVGKITLPDLRTPPPICSRQSCPSAAWLSSLATTSPDQDRSSTYQVQSE